MENVATVSMHEFVKNVYGSLKKLPVVITVRGEPRYRIEEVKYEYDGTVQMNVSFLAKDEIKKVLPSKRVYGCGCEFTGETLCKKHGRI